MSPNALGQLLSETKNGIVVNIMTYDNYGNILTNNGVQYSYDTVWKDKLVSVGDKTISYDANGNPISYLGNTLVWEKGRQLKSYSCADFNTALSYTYNANSIRTSKTIDGVTHTYTFDETKILRETWGENVLIPLYDNGDSVCGINYNGTAYYFIKNLQNDVIAITDKLGNTVAKYSYDALGACTIEQDNTDIGIATINPYRYRSYYYDTESGLYYLQSRYYDPSTGRFISPDVPEMAMIEQDVLSHNLYAYCGNDPVNKVDPSGYWVLSIGMEALVAFFAGGYAGVAVNFDGKWNVSIAYSVGVAFITNVAAYIQGYIAYYFNKKSVSQLNGWGESLGTSFSIGTHFSVGGSCDILLNKTTGGSINIAYGAGVSLYPIPYIELRKGYTKTLYKFNLLSVLKKWKNNAKKSLWYLMFNIVITKKKDYVQIYFRTSKMTIYIYKNRKVKIYRGKVRVK